MPTAGFANANALLGFPVSAKRRLRQRAASRREGLARQDTIVGIFGENSRSQLSTLNSQLSTLKPEFDEVLPRQTQAVQ